MDLNPLNTPDTVLTDCLNGTIITYNGNEFSLQNDMGNYKLQNCKLSPNYIPVGLKEHGDILYIVSYNPLNKHVEVGTYPSPLQINTINPDAELEFGSIIANELKSKNPNWNYSELSKKEKHIVFNGEDYKLYPGDEYKIEQDTNKYDYEKFEYFILDDASISHNITEEVEKGFENPDDYKFVSWIVPGWLSAKVRLAQLSSSELNIRSFYAPLEGDKRTVNFNFNFRINIEDSLVTEILKDATRINDISFEVTILKNGEIVKPELQDNYEVQLTQWYLDNKIAWTIYKGLIEDCDKDDILSVTIVPVLTEKNGDDVIYSIRYDNLKQEQIFDLSKVNDKPFGLESEFYKFYRTNDTEQVFEFDVTGPLITELQVDLKYEIYDIFDLENPIKKGDVTNYAGLGQNRITIPFEKNKFEPENVYGIRFIFTSEDGSVNMKTDPKLVITTKYLNGSESFSDYESNAMSYSAKKHMESLNMDSWKYLKLQMNNFEIDSNNEAIHKLFDTSNKYNTFVVDGADIPGSISVKSTYSVSFDNLSMSSDAKLWNNLCDAEFVYNDDEPEHVAKTNVPFELSSTFGPFKFTDATVKEFGSFWKLPKDETIPQYILRVTNTGSNVYARFGGLDEIDEIEYEVSTDYNGNVSTTFDNLLNRPFEAYGIDKIRIDNFPYYLLTFYVQNNINVIGEAVVGSIPWKEENGYKYTDLIVFSSKNAIAYEGDPNEIINNFLVIYEKDKQMIDAQAISGELKSAEFEINQKLQMSLFVNPAWNDQWENSYFKDFLKIDVSNALFEDTKSRTISEDGGISAWIYEVNESLKTEIVKDKFNSFKSSGLCTYLNWLFEQSKTDVVSGAFMIKDDPSITHYSDFRLQLHNAVNYELNGGPFDLNTDSPTFMLQMPEGRNVIIGAIYN